MRKEMGAGVVASPVCLGDELPADRKDPEPAQESGEENIEAINDGIRVINNHLDELSEDADIIRTKLSRAGWQPIMLSSLIVAFSLYAGASKIADAIENASGNQVDNTAQTPREAERRAEPAVVIDPAVI